MAVLLIGFIAVTAALALVLSGTRETCMTHVCGLLVFWILAPVEWEATFHMFSEHLSPSISL